VSPDALLDAAVQGINATGNNRLDATDFDGARTDELAVVPCERRINGAALRIVARLARQRDCVAAI
jgi:hypothetical protein